MSTKETKVEQETSVIDALMELDEDALARVWCDFNRWRWPEDLPVDQKPWWWDRERISDRKSGYIAPFMQHIRMHVSAERKHAEWLKVVDVRQT